jgi:hypothetical protein
MTTLAPVDAAASGPAPVPLSHRPDHRGSWIPTWGMVATRFMELRRRKGLMITLLAVNIGLPVVFLTFRLIAHAVDPKSYGPAGGYSIFTTLVAGVLFIFGFIVAATVGCTAGSVDLTEGMFRHLVITGRSRLALYLARIPAGLAIVLPIVAVGFAIVCTVCILAAPTQLNYDGTKVPAGLSQPALDSWATAHADEVICNFGFDIGPNSDLLQVVNSVNCGNGNGPGIKIGPGATTTAPVSHAQVEAAARQIANLDYYDYHRNFLEPPTHLIIDSGLWVLLEATIGFVVGLGLASLMGQRTVPVILMIVLEVILTPVLSRTVIPHLINAQRGIVGLAMSHLEPAGLPSPFGGNGQSGQIMLVPESRTVAVCVIVGWLVVWTALGAWRMVTRDA